MSSYAAAQTFANVEPHHIDPKTKVAFWYTDPPGFIAQVPSGVHVDLEVAEAHVTRLYADLMRIFPGVGRYYMILDWSNATGYDSDARSRFTDWCIAHRREIAEAIVVVPPHARFLRMGVQVGRLALRVVGLNLNVADSLDEVIARLTIEVRRPDNL